LKKTILTVDLGGTKILIGEVNRQGTIFNSRRYRSDVTTQRNAVNQIKANIAEYLLEIDESSQIQAIAIDVVGRVDSHMGIWKEIDPANSDPIPMAREISSTFDLPCFITNDLTAATIAENLLGVGNVTKDFIYLSIGTGLAGRIVINNEIILGKNYDAGEFGHVVVDQNSKIKCVCGRYGCIEPLASGLGMSNRTHELYEDYAKHTNIQVKPNKRVDAKLLFQSYDQDDPLAIAVVAPGLEATANLIMNLVRSLNPDAIRLGGGVATDGWYANHLQDFLNNDTMRFVSKGVKNTTLNPNTIALQGCGLFGFQQLNISKPITEKI